MVYSIGRDYLFNMGFTHPTCHKAGTLQPKGLRPPRRGIY